MFIDLDNYPPDLRTLDHVVSFPPDINVLEELSDLRRVRPSTGQVVLERRDENPGLVLITDYFASGTNEGRRVVPGEVFKRLRRPFIDSLPIYERKFQGRNYRRMIGDIAGKANEKLAFDPDLFLMVPVRRETHASEAVNLALEDARGSNLTPFAIVYHNDIRPPEEATIEDLDRLRKDSGVLVLNRQVSPDIGMGDIRRLQADVAMKIAFERGMEQPVGVAIDSDITKLTPGTLRALVELLRQPTGQKTGLSGVRVLLDPDSIASDRTRSVILEVDNLHDLMIAKAKPSWLPSGIIPAVCVGIDLGSYCYVGGHPPVPLAEDHMVVRAFKAGLGQQNAIRILPPDFTVSHDASRAIISGVRSKHNPKSLETHNRYWHWQDSADVLRPRISDNPLDITLIKEFLSFMRGYTDSRILSTGRYYREEARVLPLLDEVRRGYNDIFTKYGINI